MSDASPPWTSLQGIRVLEFGQNIAGPWAGTILANFGADVIKIEALAGDPNRHNVPRFSEDASTAFAAVNTNKRYLALDLKNPASKVVTDRLVSGSDVLIQNLRPGRAEGFGLSADALHDINPKLIHCSISAFYPNDAERPGYDVLAQAESGLMSLTGESDRRPSRIPVPVLDYSTGVWTALSVLAALHGERDRLTLRISLLEVGLAFLTDMSLSYMQSGKLPQRLGSQVNGVTPHGAYSAADGDMILSAYTQELFARLGRILGPPVADNPRYATLEDRLAHREELDEAINALLKTKPVAEWIAQFDAVGIPTAVIRNLDEALDRHARLSATGFRPVEDLSVLAPPVEVVGRPWQVRSVAGSLGQDSASILQEIGFTDDEIKDYLSKGVIA